ncbi:hypothetical protein [Photobacterium profundum]|jgi:integrase|uniref:hypothetical protein n=1 Tax=Photobacterium profundum TaxID=74109 RepID=UPI003D0AF035
MIDEVINRYRQKNIAQFLKALFPFESQQNREIAREVIALVTLIEPQYRKAFPEIDWLTQQAQNKFITKNEQDTEGVLALIVKRKELGVHYIPAFLTSHLILKSYDRDRYLQYKALTLLCVTRLAFIGTHRSKIQSICDDVRLFSQGKREDMAAFLPDIHSHTFPELVKAFNQLVDENNIEVPNTRIRNQLNRYRRSYEASLDHADGFTRKSCSTQFNKQSQLEISSRKTLEEDDSEYVIELRQILSNPNKIQHEWQREDLSSEVNRTINIVTTKPSKNTSYATDILKARAIHARIQKKELMLACDITRMTNFEAGALTSYCLEQIRNGHPSALLAKAILVMLFSGNSLDLVTKLKAQRYNNQTLIGFKRSHRVPAQKQRDELSPLINKTSETFWLPLPRIVSNKLRSLTFKAVHETDVKTLIKHINSKHGTAITITKIAAFLSQKLTHENIDPTIIALIRGTAIKEVPALFYTQLTHKQVYTPYKRYVQFLFNLANAKDDLIWPDLTNNRILLGSTLSIDHDQLKSLLRLLISEIRSVQHMEGVTSKNVHNLITLYVQLVLSMASGYRPVTGWFGRLNHLHMASGDYWISDKESGITDSSRVIVLPQRALALLKKYKEYSYQMSVSHENVALTLSLRYKALLSSQEHLFFYRSEHGIIECTPSSYTEQIDSIFPLQPNWARHHMRTLLQERNIEADIISTWMGHQHHAKRAFHSHSMLNRKHMLVLAQVIDSYLNELGVEVHVW